MPPYGVRRKCGKNPKPVRAAASRPYAVPSTWSVGRGAHTPPGSGRRNHRSPEHNAPGSGRIYNPPLRQDSRRRRNIAVRPVGADCISAHAQPPQLSEPGPYRTRFRRHVGMPPYGVRRKCGKNPKPVRAAASRPYAVPSTWSVGRGAHTPPGSGRRNHRSPEHNAPGSGRIYNPPLRQDSRRRRNIAVRPVGADCISAHAQPPQLSEPGPYRTRFRRHVGMPPYAPALGGIGPSGWKSRRNVSFV